MNKTKLTMNELFSGIGAQKRGIDMTKLFDLEVVSTADIDKFATVSYAAIHNGLTKQLIDTYDEYPSRQEMAQFLSDRNIGYNFQKKQSYNWNRHLNSKKPILEMYYLACVLSNNLGDISLISKLPYADLWTYSFPCTDISVAGKQKGIIKDKTRSGLLYEVERLLEMAARDNMLPKYLLLENVKNLVGIKHKPDFDRWVGRLNELGFNTYWEIVNGKDCGIPQNRERVFGISIRKDIDTKTYVFPKPFNSSLRLGDLLEEEIGDKYYLNEKIQKRFQITDETFTKNIVGTTKTKSRTVGQRDLVYQKDSIIGALLATDYKQPKQILEESIKEKAVCEERTDEGLRFFQGDYIGTLRTTNSCGDKRVIEQYENTEGNRSYRIRKLTPRESFRLMGFTDEDIDKAIAVDISDTQLYKQAGNSIITNCIALLIEHLYKAQYDDTYQCSSEQIYNKENTANKEGHNAIGCAMRGRRGANGTFEQKIEMRKDELSNALTTVQKDSLVIELKNN